MIHGMNLGVASVICNPVLISQSLELKDPCYYRCGQVLGHGGSELVQLRSWCPQTGSLPGKAGDQLIWGRACEQDPVALTHRKNSGFLTGNLLLSNTQIVLYTNVWGCAKIEKKNSLQYSVVFSPLFLIILLKISMPRLFLFFIFSVLSWYAKQSTIYLDYFRIFQDI